MIFTIFYFSEKPRIPDVLTPLIHRDEGLIIVFAVLMHETKDVIERLLINHGNEDYVRIDL